MRSKYFVVAISAFMFIMTGCDNTKDDNNVTGIEITTTDINQAPLFFNFGSVSYENVHDITFLSGDMTYLVGLNGSAGVVGVKSGINDFTTATLPTAGYASDGDGNYVVGDSWMDMSTYNPSDHSIQGDGSVYFIRTASYEWVKFEVLSGSPSSFSIQYAFRNTDGTYGAAETATIPYTSAEPAYFDLTTGSVIPTADWQLALTLVPEYSPELSSFMYMPTILTNMDASVQVAIIDDMAFDDVVTAPVSGWMMDEADMHPLGYGGDYMVLVYHPEPPYNHKVIVENPGYVYIIDTGNYVYKLQFKLYNSGIMLFSYEGL